MPRSSTMRVEFTGEHDAYLYKYLAKYYPSKEGRKGKRPFQRLIENADERWPWSVHHPWQSWRERYVKNADRFDVLIQRYQDKHGAQPGETAGKRKRAAEQTPVDEPGRSAKRARTEARKEEVEEEEEVVKEVVVTSSETRTETPVEKPPSTPTPQTHVQPEARPSSPTSATNDDTRQPTLDLTSRATVELPPSSPDRPTTRTDGPRPSKFRKKRQRESPDVFASEPSSPPGSDRITRPSSQAPPTSSAPTEDDSVGTMTYPRAPPRIVNSIHGKVIADDNGHVPRAILLDETDEEEQEEEDIKASDEVPNTEVEWPPVRSRTKASESDVQVDGHHPFNQPPSRPEPKPACKPDQDAAVAQVREDDVTQNGTSPIQRNVSDLSGHVPERFATGSNSRAPRLSIASPTRLASTTHPHAVLQASAITPQQPAQPVLAKIARHHPALTRIRQQSLQRDAKNGRQRTPVPSVDLVALSRASTSRSHSRSSGASAAARSPRWSAPTRIGSAAWMLDSDSGSASGSPFGRTDDRARPSASMWTSSPSRSFLGGVPPGVGASVTPPSAISPHAPDVPLTASHGLASLLAGMAANHGLALGTVERVYRGVGSLREADEVLRGMREAAEGFGMREIERREGKGKGKARERVRVSLGVGSRVKARAGRKWMGSGTGRHDVVSSEEGEMPEYLPPETSRAAMWMRQASHAQRQQEEEEEEEADEEEARAVKKDLGVDDDEDAVCMHHHDFSRCADVHEARGRDDVVREPEQGATVDRYVLAHERERKMGRRLFRKETQRRFV